MACCQAGGGCHCNLQALSELHCQVQGFDKSPRTILAKSKPINEELRSFIDQGFAPNNRTALSRCSQERAYNFSATEHKQVEILKTFDYGWSKKGHGFYFCFKSCWHHSTQEQEHYWQTSIIEILWQIGWYDFPPLKNLYGVGTTLGGYSQSSFSGHCFYRP